jgi:hypothetical protein
VKRDSAIDPFFRAAKPAANTAIFNSSFLILHFFRVNTPFLHKGRYAPAREQLTMSASSRIVFLFAALLAAANLFAQETNKYSIGTWRDHFPYGKTVDVCSGLKNTIYTATPYSVFAFHPGDNSVERINKTNKLSDVGISAMEFDPASEAVVIGYENGNLDFLFPTRAANLPDIKVSSFLGDKRIYDILPFNGLLYLSTGFGIVVVDPVRFEVKSTFFIGSNGSPMKINDVAVNADSIYAATEQGVFKADVRDPFLQNYANWSKKTDVPLQDSSVTEITFFVNNMFLNYGLTQTDQVWRRPLEQGGSWISFAQFAGLKFNDMWSNEEWLTLSGNGAFQVYHFDLYMTVNSIEHNGFGINANAGVVDPLFGFFCANNTGGLLWQAYDGVKKNIQPQGPERIDVRKMGVYNDNLWLAPGGVTGFYGNLFNDYNISALVDDSWQVVRNTFTTNNGTPPLDYITAAVDPKDVKHVYMGSWEEGIVEIYDGKIVSIYNPNNSSVQYAGFTWAPTWAGIGGSAFDVNGIAWFANAYTSRCIQSRDRNGNFKAYNFSPTITAQDEVTDILPTQMGYVWALVPGKGLLAFDYNESLDNTADDSYKLLTDVEGQGGLPTKDVLCMEEDLDGELWVGTLQGLTVFYNQDAVFSDENFDAEQILITQDGNVQILLETEAITAIRIDGSNRKWIGTQNSGVYLFSPDGLSEVFHFTVENSPLPSNFIYDIAINQRTGEVYVATEKGLVGFFGTATNFDQEMETIRAFPNPVTEDYDGNVVIDGLAYDTTVKITDLQGNLIYETQSEGGRAVWNGRRLDGERPSSGVYLVFAAEKDGKPDNVTKLTFIK